MRVRDHLTDHGLLFLMVFPNLVWILLDRGKWISDTSLYALDATRLHHTLLHDTSRWWSELLAVGPKPPILPWVGQFFVEVGRLIGNIDIGLLFVIFGAQYGALWLLRQALMAQWHERSLALLGCLAVASTPMFIRLSSQFYVQSVQLLAVCWFLYVMMSSRKWDSLLTLLHLAAASALAMLAIVSSPIYCFVPGGIALAHAWANRKLPIEIRGTHRGMIVVAVAFATLAVFWYRRNLEEALDYGRFGFTWAYGANVRNVFWLKLADWIRYVVFGFALTAALLSLLVPWAATLESKRDSRPRRRRDALVVSLLCVQVAVILLAATAASQQTFRYIFPMVAYFAVLLTWSIYRLDKRWLKVSAAAALALQLVVTNAGLYLWDDQRFARDRRRYLDALEAVDSFTRASPGPARETVWLGIGELGVYAFDAVYKASKSDDYYHGRSPEYLSIETSFTSGEIDGDIEALWERIEGSQGADVVLMRSPPRLDERKADDTWQPVIRATIEITNRVRRSPKFEKIATPDSWELEIYRTIEGT